MSNDTFEERWQKFLVKRAERLGCTIEEAAGPCECSREAKKQALLSRIPEHPLTCNELHQVKTYFFIDGKEVSEVDFAALGGTRTVRTEKFVYAETQKEGIA